MSVYIVFFRMWGRDWSTCSLRSGVLSFNLSALAFFRVPAAPPGHGEFLVSLCGPPPDPSSGGAFARCAAPVAVAQMVDTCYRLGTSSVTALSSVTFSQAPEAPGFSVSHSDGDECGRAGLPRRVRLNVACSATADSSAFEDETCSYVVTVNSPAACPLQCPRDEHGAVCGSAARGECVLSADGGAECACAPGLVGAACEEAAVSVIAPTLLVADLPALPLQLGAKGGGAAPLAARAGLASLLCLFLWAARRHSLRFAAALMLAFLTLMQPELEHPQLPMLGQQRLRELEKPAGPNPPPAWAHFAVGEWVGEEGREVWVPARDPGNAAVSRTRRPVRILLLGDSVDRYLVADGCEGLGANAPWDWSDGLFPYRHGMSGAGLCSTPDGSVTLASLHLFGAAPAGPYLHNHGGELDDTAPRIHRGLAQFRKKVEQGPSHIVYQSNNWDALLHLREHNGPALLRAFVGNVNATLARLRELEPLAALLVRTTPSNMPLKAMYNEGLRAAAALQGVAVLDWGAQATPLLLQQAPFYRDNGMHPSVYYSRAFALQLVEWASALQLAG